MCVVRTTWTYPRTSKLMMDFVFISLVVGCTFRSHHSAYFVYLMRLSLHILFINVFFHLHIYFHFHIHVLSVVAVAVLIVMLSLSCRWKWTQPAGTRALLHVTGRLVFICWDRCGTSSLKGVHIRIEYIYIYIISHTCFVVHLDNYTNAYSIYLYLKKGSAKLGFAELQMLRFAWPLFGSTPVRIMEVALIWSPTIVWCGLVPRHCWDGWELCHVHWTLGRSVWMSWVFPGFYFWSTIIFLDLYFLYTYTYTIVYRFVIHDMFHLLYEMMVATLNASNGTIAQTC